jgi:hypothetical protein
MRGSDFFFIALSLAVSLASISFASKGQAGTPTLVVESPQGKWVYQMNSSRDIVISGTIGESTLELRDGKVRFLESPCENKLCVIHAPLSNNGDWNACLPHRVMVHIEGGDYSGTQVNSSSQELDATAF